MCAVVASVGLDNVAMFCINRIFIIPVLQFSFPASGLVKNPEYERVTNYSAGLG